MHNTCTILCCDIVAWYDTECIFVFDDNFVISNLTWFHPWHELLIMYTDKLAAFTTPYYFKLLLVIVGILLWFEVC